MSRIEKLTQQKDRMARRGARLLVTIMCATPSQKRTPEYKAYVQQKKHISQQLHYLGELINREHANGTL